MISCVCCHYGRTWLLAEAIESFIRQDFDKPAELIVINDHPDITLRQHQDIHDRLPEGRHVRFVNWGKRMATLSHKFDYGVQLARYGLICMWDDDDLALPNRLQYTAYQWLANGKPAYLSFGKHFYCGPKGVELCPRGVHGADVMTSKAYWKVGGSTGEGHNDQNLVGEIKRNGMFTKLDDCIPFYLYRWSHVGSHHSSHLDLQDAMAAFDYQVRRSPFYREGELTIRPSYTAGTEALVQQAQAIASAEAIRQIRGSEAETSSAEA